MASSVTITTPSGNTQQTGSTVNLAGTAVFGSRGTYTKVTYETDRGYTGNCTASEDHGNVTWSVNNVTVLAGDNTIAIYLWGTYLGVLEVVASSTVVVTKIPTMVITSPTSNPTYSTSSSTVTLGGTATGYAGNFSWTNSAGGSGSVTAAASWTKTGITLYSGVNVITVTASNGYGNTASDTLTVTYTGAGGDTTPPICTITDPTAGATYATATSPITTIAGTASDAVGVTSVTWTCDTGGSGTATGTTDWSIASITLTVGANVITVSAHDAAGNIGQDTITVTYSETDTADPTIEITSPTDGATWTTYNAHISLSGVAADDLGVASVTWANLAGGSGTATGTTTWNIPTVSLAVGLNTITCTATDAASNTGTDEIEITYSTSIRVARYFVGGYGSTCVYDASWGSAVGSQFTAAQPTDDGTAITSYIKTRRSTDPGKTAQKTAKYAFITTNMVGDQSLTYNLFVDNNHSSLASNQYAITCANGFVDNLVGITMKHRKIQHYLKDSAVTPVEYVSITEIGEITKAQ
jgi:hypothetical protein